MLAPEGQSLDSHLSHLTTKPLFFPPEQFALVSVYLVDCLNWQNWYYVKECNSRFDKKHPGVDMIGHECSSGTNLESCVCVFILRLTALNTDAAAFSFLV